MTIPITIITGFLGSGKTTLILNLIPQLPPSYRLALIKNEFGDVAIDSQLASSSAIAGTKELLNGCICCNLVGSLGDALEELRTTQNPDRIVIETSGSAFPATLALEVGRIAKETGHYELDGVVSVIDVENWRGYEDTSVTAKLQAKYTDLIVLNKWESVSERALDEVIDRILDLELDVPTPREKSDHGWVSADVLLGLDAKLARGLKKGSAKRQEHSHTNGHSHGHDHDHHSEVEVLSVTLSSASQPNGVDLTSLDTLLHDAPKDEVYRIKAILYALAAPIPSSGQKAPAPQNPGFPARYILNWAFGRWNFTIVPSGDLTTNATPSGSATDTPLEPSTPLRAAGEPVLRMTVVCVPGESARWRGKIEKVLRLQEEPGMGLLQVARIS
jgi:G3E family GTPase